MFNFLKSKEVSLCSKVYGRILLDGKPMLNLKIVRSLDYIGEHKYQDSTLSNEDGIFSFEPYSIKSRAPKRLFSESRVFQYIYVIYEGEEKVLWSTMQYGCDEVPAYSKKLSSMCCDLSNPKVNFDFYGRASLKRSSNSKFSAISICRWEDNFEISETLNN
ncbi:hypothetical protein MSP8887_04179 [Marinomonas spartinae]|uniref:DUF6795 domain-containing protein n=1 Tax=Marinomonas spartinae TaxID=1792290 RepID=UPI000808B469|nr:DUF6795 domain-containing protein [Marinomonas spartinae]SBS40089.1 hypothetical protein MSP8887_04179 [Marinomonas spartinae]